MFHIFFIHLSVDEHLGRFHHLAIMNSAAISTGLQVSVWDVDLHSFENMPRCGMGRS
jgi:hypothetical protein